MSKNNTPRFLLPADPKNFTGQRKLINDFRKTLLGFKSNKAPSNALVVIGEAGNGKSSLLQMFEKSAEAEKILMTRIDIFEQPNKVFQQIFDFMGKFRMEEKKSRFKKSKKDFYPFRNRFNCLIKIWETRS